MHRYGVSYREVPITYLHQRERLGLAHAPASRNLTTMTPFSSCRQITCSRPTSVIWLSTTSSWRRTRPSSSNRCLGGCISVRGPWAQRRRWGRRTQRETGCSAVESRADGILCVLPGNISRMWVRRTIRSRRVRTDGRDRPSLAGRRTGPNRSDGWVASRRRLSGGSRTS